MTQETSASGPGSGGASGAGLNANDGADGNDTHPTSISEPRKDLTISVEDFNSAASTAGHKLIAVTGATEFIGSHVVKELLSRGRYVRAVVHEKSSSEFLRNLPNGLNRLQIITVRDFHTDDCLVDLENAFQGAYAIVHAAPVGVQMLKKQTAPSTRILEAVQQVVKAASKENSTVKRLVYVSSEKTVYDSMVTSSNSQLTLTETDWYDVSRTDKETLDKVSYSHTVAEMKLWSLATEVSVPFTVCSVVPSFVFGPVLSPVHISTAHALRFLHGALSGRFLEIPSVPCSPVDVRDVAWSCVELTDRSEVSGRILLCAEDMTAQEVLKTGESVYPRYPWPKPNAVSRWKLWDRELADSRKLLKTFHFMSKSRHGHRYFFRQDRALQILSIEYRSFADTMRDTIDSIVQSACVSDLRISVSNSKDSRS